MNEGAASGPCELIEVLLSRSGSALALLGKRVQIAGSANPKTGPTLIQYAHRLVGKVVSGVLKAGGGLVLGVGKEPRAEIAGSDGPSLTFDWTAIESAAKCLRNGRRRWPSRFGPPLAVVASEKAESEIPGDRQSLWHEVLDREFVKLERIQAGARSGAMLRDVQARSGDALFILGGGTGVEHLAKLYMSRRCPVVPLDLQLGSSRGDGTGGAERLALECRADPSSFFSLRASGRGTEGARLAGIATKKGAVNADKVARKVVELFAALQWPKVFYVRLLNKKHSSFNRVDAFFRNVVDPVVKAAGFDRIEMGTDATKHAFINVGVFEKLHFAPIVVADVTGERPNCFLELGYALGRPIRVIVTAEEGTPLPFDQQAIPCYFWRHGVRNTKRRAELTAFWEKYVDRFPLVNA